MKVNGNHMCHFRSNNPPLVLSTFSLSSLICLTRRGLWNTHQAPPIATGLRCPRPSPPSLCTGVPRPGSLRAADRSPQGSRPWELPLCSPSRGRLGSGGLSWGSPGVPRTLTSAGWQVSEHLLKIKSWYSQNKCCAQTRYQGSYLNIRERIRWFSTGGDLTWAMCGDTGECHKLGRG